MPSMPSVSVTASSSACSASTLRDQGHGASSQSGSFSRLQPVAGRRVGERDALRHDAPRARRDRRGDQVARALGADAVVARELLLHLARVDRRGQVGQLVHDDLGLRRARPRPAALGVEDVAHRRRRARLAQGLGAVLAARSWRSPRDRASSSSGSSRRPITPVAPARKTFTPAASPTRWRARPAARAARRPLASGRRTPPSAAAGSRS